MEVHEVAKQSFQVSFADPKRNLEEVLIFNAPEMISQIEENLWRPPTDKSIEKYDQVVATSLLALSALIRMIPPSTDQCEELSDFKLAACNIFHSQDLFHRFFKSTSASVRSAVYQVTQGYTILESEVSFNSHSKLILGALNEKDPICHQLMWEIVLFYCRDHGHAWERSSRRKGLWSLLKNGCYGSPQFSYPRLLLLLSTIPPSAILSMAKRFFVKFFTNACEQGVWTLEDGKLLVDTIKECLLWVVENSQRYSPYDPERIQFSVVETVCLKLLFRTYAAVDSKEGEAKKSSLLSSTEFMEQVGNSIVDILSSVDEQLRAPVWTSVLEECLMIVQQGEELPLECMAQFLMLGTIDVDNGNGDDVTIENWPKDAAALKNFAKEWGIVVSKAVRRLSGKRQHIEPQAEDRESGKPDSASENNI